MKILGDSCDRVWHPLFPASRCEEALADARSFFALPAEVKQELAIERSAHFRGYSIMRNERDWREQIHFGVEEEPVAGTQLRGPNQWPPDEGWKRRMLVLMRDLEQAGRDILSELAGSLGLSPNQFLAEGEQPYLLLKLIHYEAWAQNTARTGVAPHVDFSWITLLLQDETGGLEVRSEDGSWRPIEPVPGTLVVNIGEILEYASGGHFRATPHRVVSGAKSRISMPFFLNPALSTRIEPAPTPGLPWSEPDGGGHVHRVFSDPRRSPFVFGEQEWRRKGEGIFCGACFRRE